MRAILVHTGSGDGAAIPRSAQAKRQMLRRWAALAILCGGTAAGQEWTSLFDGVSLQGWKETPFRSRGTVQVKDNAIELGKGRLTGVTWTGSFPKSGYEIRFEAVRRDGNGVALLQPR